MGQERCPAYNHRLPGPTSEAFNIGSTSLLRGYKMPVEPRQNAAQQDHGLESILDIVGLTIGCLFCIISAVPTMKSYSCNEQQTAESGSASFLRLYPCEGSGMTRAAFLARYSPCILRNLLSQHGQQDVWLVAFLTFWLLRVASRICLPPRLYTNLAAPCLTFAARASPLVLLLAAGRKSPLSSAASLFVFRNHGLFDAIVSVTQPASFTSVEIAFNVFSVVCIGLLAAWHGGTGISGDHFASSSHGSDSITSSRLIAQVLLQRVALMVAVHWLAGCVLRRRRPGYGHDGPDGAQHDSSQSSSTTRHQAVQSSSPLLPATQLRQQRLPEAHVVDGIIAVATNGAAGFNAETAVQHCKYRSGVQVPDANADVKTSRTRRSGDAAAPCVDVSAASGYQQLPDQLCGSGQAPAVRAAVEGTGVLPYSTFFAALPYKSPIRRHSVRVKIPFAEPDQILPGYAERLQALAAEKGLTLAGVYVRQGCIELLLDIDSILQAAALNVNQSMTQIPLLRPGASAPSSATAASEFLNSSGISDMASSLTSDLDSILCALGLPGSQGAPLDEQAMSTVAVAAVTLGRVTDPRSLTLTQPSILQLSPRVLLRPPLSIKIQKSLHFSVTVAQSLASLTTGEMASAAGNSPTNSSDAAGSGAGVKELASAAMAPQILARSQGAYLRAVVTPTRTDSLCGGKPCGDSPAMSYDVELLELPPYPGSILVEVCNNGVRSPAVPLLLLDDASVTQELQSAFSFINTFDAITESTAGNASTDSPADDVSTMVYNDAGDDLLLDLGAWVTYAAAAASNTIDAPQLPMNLPQGSAMDMRALAEHLLPHLQECGWTTTAKYIRSTLEAVRHDATVAAVCTASTAVKASGTIAAPATAADGDVIHRWLAPLLPPSTHALLRTAFLQAVGLDMLPPKEEEVYQAYAALRALAYDYVIQAVEVMSLLALLFRARQQLLHPSNLTTLSGCAVGTLTALAWPLLPTRHYRALINAVKVPRYLFYINAKLMIGWLGFQAPPGIVTYQLGLAMLIMEGVLLPFSCLLSTRMALLLALIKFPFAVGMMLRSEATSDPVWAAVCSLRIVLAAVATTVTCHTYLRFSYAAWEAPKAAVSGVGKLQQSSKGEMMREAPSAAGRIEFADARDIDLSRKSTAADSSAIVLGGKKED